MPLDLVDTLCSLVGTPSVNPMGRPFSGDEFLEHAMTARLSQLFEQLGLPSEQREVEPGRRNIIARLEGSKDPLQGGPLIVFEAHQDTVPVDGMTISPWSPEVKDGKVFGRGACDIKGGMTCMLKAISRLVEERPSDLPTVIMACSVNEEHGYSGAEDLAGSWSNGESSLVPRTPDAVIVAEPTELQVIVAHKGVVRWRCHAHGKASHSARPHLGDNAIFRMRRVLEALERYANEVAPDGKSHPLVGHPTLSVGIISGGISVNTVPDRCTIEIDRRVVPGEDAEAARQEVIDFVSQEISGDDQVEHEAPFICANGLDDANNGQLASDLGAIAEGHGGTAEPGGVPYGTDAPSFAAIGAPTVVFGPGSIDQAHTCDEWIRVDQLERAAEVYYEFAKSVGRR